MSIRWAAIGTGTISRSVIPDLSSCVGNDVRVVHSRDAAKAQAFAEEFGIPSATGEYQAILGDPSIDAVYIATPYAQHYVMTRQAILAGKHVLVEKPMAMNRAQVSDLFALASEHGVFLMEAMWMKFNPAFRRLHEEIQNGRIGDVRSLRAAFSVPIPDDGGSRWDMSMSGGALLDQGIYPVTLAHSLFGAPASVVAAGDVRVDGVDLAEHYTLEFGEGRFAQCSSAMTEFADLSAAVSGTEGWLTLPSPFWATTSIEIHAGGTREIFYPVAPINLDREGNGYVPMLREVAEMITGGQLEHPVHTRDDTVEVFRTLDTIRHQITEPYPSRKVQA
jgi:predicted dehydrogenase